MDDTGSMQIFLGAFAMASSLTKMWWQFVPVLEWDISGFGLTGCQVESVSTIMINCLCTSQLYCSIFQFFKQMPCCTATAVILMCFFYVPSSFHIYFHNECHILTVKFWTSA